MYIIVSIKKLILDDFFEEDSFGVIGIHCNLSDYRLAYILNNTLKINLKRHHENLDFANSFLSYSFYEFEDTQQQTTYNLISNTSKVEVETQGDRNSLFNMATKTSKTYYLVPEYKAVNYLLKITNELFYLKQKQLLKKLLLIPQIVTAYNIDIDNIKHKDHLIF